VAVVLVLVLLGAVAVASGPLAGVRHPMRAQRAPRTTPTQPTPGRRPAATSAGRAASCPALPPVPAETGKPVGAAGRSAQSSAVRHSPWVRSRLPVSGQAGKTVALTFDDGPDPRFTPRILAILARARAPATFFMLGSQAATHPDLVRRVASAGQAVGGHTWHHTRLDRLTSAGVAAEVDCTDRLLAMRGVQLVLWTVDARDWARPGVGRIQATVARELRPGAIVLFHDGGGDRSQTVAALPGVLGLLQARGYRVVALPTPRVAAVSPTVAPARAGLANGVGGALDLGSARSG
jgi:peptidoglycan-N-acetylglucosamine deacetylase